MILGSRPSGTHRRETERKVSTNHILLVTDTENKRLVRMDIAVLPPEHTDRFQQGDKHGR